MAQTVENFQSNPKLALDSMANAGFPALPYPSYMVAGSPFPMSAQIRLPTWNRKSNPSTPMPAGITYNAPYNRVVQV